MWEKLSCKLNVIEEYGREEKLTHVLDSYVKREEYCSVHNLQHRELKHASEA